MSSPYKTSESSRKRTVFVVHGRNLAARDAIFSFLRSIDLHPLEWSEVRKETGKPIPYIGEILDTAFSVAQAIVVLMTPDDIAFLQPQFLMESDPPYERLPTPQARPNVLFEAGMAMGRAPDRTILVELGNLRPFSDIGGRHVVRLNDSTERRQDLAMRLKDAGCIVNLDGTSWHRAGQFNLGAIGISQFSPSEFKAKLAGDQFPNNITLDQFTETGIKNFIRDRLNESFLRARALILSFHLNIVDSQFLNGLATENTPGIRKALASSIGDYRFPASDTILVSLMKDDDLEVANSAVESAFKLICENVGGFDSRIISAASENASWDVRYRAIRRIISIDDEYSVRSLARFRTTTYHLARNAIRKYFERLDNDNRLQGDTREEALDLLQHFVSDGKSSDTTIKKISRTLDELNK